MQPVWKGSFEEKKIKTNKKERREKRKKWKIDRHPKGKIQMYRIVMKMKEEAYSNKGWHECAWRLYVGQDSKKRRSLSQASTNVRKTMLRVRGIHFICTRIVSQVRFPSRNCGCYACPFSPRGIWGCNMRRHVSGLRPKRKVQW